MHVEDWRIQNTHSYFFTDNTMYLSSNSLQASFIRSDSVHSLNKHFPKQSTFALVTRANLLFENLHHPRIELYLTSHLRPVGHQFLT